MITTVIMLLIYHLMEQMTARRIEITNVGFYNKGEGSNVVGNPGTLAAARPKRPGLLTAGGKAFCRMKTAQSLFTLRPDASGSGPQPLSFLNSFNEQMTHFLSIPPCRRKNIRMPILSTKKGDPSPEKVLQRLAQYKKEYSYFYLVAITLLILDSVA